MNKIQWVHPSSKSLSFLAIYFQFPLINYLEIYPEIEKPVLQIQLVIYMNTKVAKEKQQFIKQSNIGLMVRLSNTKKLTCSEIF